MSLPIAISRRAERDMTLQYQWYLMRAGFDIAERYLQAVDEAAHAWQPSPASACRVISSRRNSRTFAALPLAEPLTNT